jgi:hypothetical protein
VLIYVDDIIVASSSSTFTDALVKKLKQEFALKELGVHYFLGIMVRRTKKGLLMTHERYALDIMKHVNMSSCKAVSNPMLLCEMLLINDGEPLGPKDASQYRSIVGALRYLTLTHL